MNCGVMGADKLAGKLEPTDGSMPVPPIPGGFGAAGGPNDGFHQYLHHVRKCYMKAAV